jgi:hypothetical protein
MDTHQEKRVLAVGLMRKAAQLLDDGGDPHGAAAIEATLAVMLKAKPLGAPEIDPETAALVAGMPLSEMP